MNVLSFGEVLWDICDGEETLGGAPLNFSAHALSAGANSYIVSAVGCDEYGDKTLDAIKKLGVSTLFVSKTTATTGKCLVTLDELGVPSYNLLNDVAYDFISAPSLTFPVDALCYGTLALRSAQNRKALSSLLSSPLVKKTYCDLNLRKPFFSKETIAFCLENASIIKFSEDEFELVCSLFHYPSRAEFFSAYPNCELILVTCGERGAFAYTRTSEFFQPAVKTTVVSTVGAGDSFGATFLVNYLKGEPIPRCLYEGAKRSALVCSIEGAIPD